MSGIDGSGAEAFEGRIKNAILIAGPTASGKSALALDLAVRTGGVIVNTDSMQGYSILDVLTARPGRQDQERAPHHLYGHIHPSMAYSTGMWLRDVMRLINDGMLDDKPVIFVGGTGLYFRALAEGISPMPDIPHHIREHWRQALIKQGAVTLHQVLMSKDPEMAATLREGDGQRIVRALEVFEGSGRSLQEWQAARGHSLIDHASARLFVFEPDRSELLERIEKRFDQMVARGAIEEVRSLYALQLDPALPAMKAIGVRELHGVIEEKISLAEAVERSKIATRQYAKRQVTWFRHQLGANWQRLDPAKGHEIGI